MNYEKLYGSLIAKRRREVLCKRLKAESHHITPVSWGGTDEISNLIYLTRREHFLAHLLLVKLADSTSKRLSMLSAVKFMCRVKNSRAYELRQEQYQEIHNLYMSEVIGNCGETRRELTTRKSAKTMKTQTRAGKSLLEHRLGKASAHNNVVVKWNHSDGRIFTGTAFELSRKFRSEFIEPSKLMKFLGQRRHRGWSHKEIKSKVELKYTESYSWVNEQTLQEFTGTCYQLAKIANLWPNKLLKAVINDTAIRGWKAIKVVWSLPTQTIFTR